MPQLVPFYYMNQVTFTFLVILLLIPRFVRLFSTRLL